MSTTKPHRKRVKHYHDPGDLHELTFSCYRRMPLLTNNHWRELLSQAVDRAITGQGYRLVAFVLMPEHVHLIVCPLPGGGGIGDFLKAVKRPYSYRIKQLLVAQRSPLLSRLTISQRPGVKTFRYWQEGPGYDRNLKAAKAVLAAVDYLHLNPVRRNLCRTAIDWRWSSARHFVEDRPQVDPCLPTIHGLPDGLLGPEVN